MDAHTDLILIADATRHDLDAARVLADGTRVVAHARGGWRIDGAHDTPETRTRIDAWCRDHRVDHAWIARGARLRDFALLALDMDSTLVTIETIDEIADFVGRKAEVAAITEAAMRGEITDYAESLRRRVALLAGLRVEVLDEVYATRMRLSLGAEPLIAAAHAAGLRTLLVSGGFTYFTDRLRDRLSLGAARSNVLEVRDGVLTGGLVGEIVDAQVKARTVADECAALGVSTDRAIAMGDGANDLHMMRLAGLSVAYRAKPRVRAQASVAFDHCGLDGLLAVLPD